MHTKSLFALGFIVLFGSGCAFEPAEEASSSETAAAEQSPTLDSVLPVELPSDEVTTAPESEFDDAEPAVPSAGGDEDDIEAENAGERDCVVRYVVTESGSWIALPCS